MALTSLPQPRSSTSHLRPRPATAGESAPRRAEQATDRRPPAPSPRLPPAQPRRPPRCSWSGSAGGLKGPSPRPQHPSPRDLLFLPSTGAGPDLASGPPSWSSNSEDVRWCGARPGGSLSLPPAVLDLPRCPPPGLQEAPQPHCRPLPLPGLSPWQSRCWQPEDGPYPGAPEPRQKQTHTPPSPPLPSSPHGQW